MKHLIEESAPDEQADSVAAAEPPKSEVQRAKGGLLLGLPIYADDPDPVVHDRDQAPAAPLVDASRSSEGWRQFSELIETGRLDDIDEATSDELAEIAYKVSTPKSA